MQLLFARSSSVILASLPLTNSSTLSCGSRRQFSVTWQSAGRSWKQFRVARDCATSEEVGKLTAVDELATGIDTSTSCIGASSVDDVATQNPSLSDESAKPEVDVVVVVVASTLNLCSSTSGLCCNHVGDRRVLSAAATGNSRLLFPVSAGDDVILEQDDDEDAVGDDVKRKTSSPDGSRAGSSCIAVADCPDGDVIAPFCGLMT